MKLFKSLALAAFAAAAMGTAPVAQAKLEQKDVQSLIAHIEQSMFPEIAVSHYKLTHFKKDQVLKTFAFEMSMKDDKSLLAMNWPATSKHKYLLKSGPNLWMYFSDVRRSIRLSARDSFMGTDANNYDMMQLNLLKDYDIVGFAEAELDGQPVARVELTARPDTEGYAKIVSWISIREKRLMRNDCYSISGALIKTVHYREIFEVGKYRIPSSVLITSHVNKDRSTLMEISKVLPKTRGDLKDSMFTLGYLETVD